MDFELTDPSIIDFSPGSDACRGRLTAFNCFALAGVVLRDSDGLLPAVGPKNGSVSFQHPFMLSAQCSNFTFAASRASRSLICLFRSFRCRFASAVVSIDPLLKNLVISLLRSARYHW